MPYEPEVDSGRYTHELRFVHNPTSIEIFCQIQLTDPQPGTEAQRDAVFQGLVSKVAELANITILSAKKTTAYTSDCLP